MPRGVDVGAKRGQVPQLRQQTSEGLAAQAADKPVPRQAGATRLPRAQPSAGGAGQGAGSCGCYSHVALVGVNPVEQSLGGHPLHWQATLGREKAPHQQRATREQRGRP